MADGLFTFGTNEVVELPPSDARPDTANDLTKKNPLGVLCRHKGNMYRYVQFDNGTDNVAAVQYGVVYWKTLDPDDGSFIVTGDVSSAIAAGKGTVAGITGCVVTDQYYTWIQVAGTCTAKCAGSMVAGDYCIWGTDNTFGRDANASLADLCFGVALEVTDVTNALSTVLLQNLDW